MRALSLGAKVTFVLVLSLLVVEAVGASVAATSFHDAEVRHARAAAQNRVQFVASVLNVRFLDQGQAVMRAANDVAEGGRPSEIADEARRWGFDSVIVLGPGGLLDANGGAMGNASMQQLLAQRAPAPADLGIHPIFRDGVLSIAARSTSHDYVVVGAIGRDALGRTYSDLLVHPTDSLVLLTRDGQVMARSSSLPDAALADPSLLLRDEATLPGAGLFHAEHKSLTTLDAYAVEMIPDSYVTSLAQDQTVRFVLGTAVAILVAGGATLVIVHLSLRPLARITAGAHKLGEGAESLQLDVRSRDEMGVLARALERSAAALAQSRRAQKAAEEEFELAVGELARSVGEADTVPETARRLVESVLRATPARAAIALREGAILHASAGEQEPELDAAALEALYATRPDAFRSFRPDREIELAVLASPLGLSEGEARKVGILAAQGALAVHRAQINEDLRVTAEYLDRLVGQKQVFVDILSHDLKNPLAVARGRVEMIAAREPALAERCRAILESLDRATRIIEEAVLYSKLERQDELERAPCDLVALARDAVALLEPLAQQREVRLAVRGPGALPWQAHPLLSRALENILSNAIKWSPAGAEVAVVLDADANACRLAVVDHGPGIADEDKRRLFARFERADKTGVKGVGLGLAIGKRVVDMHGGAIRILDTQGGGSTFEISLPASPHPAPRLLAASRPTAPGGSA